MANATERHTLLINSLKIRFFKVQLTSFQHHDHNYTDQQQIIHFVWDHFDSLQEIDFNWLGLVICMKIDWMRQKSKLIEYSKNQILQLQKLNQSIWWIQFTMKWCTNFLCIFTFNFSWFFFWRREKEYNLKENRISCDY